MTPHLWNLSENSSVLFKTATLAKAPIVDPLCLWQCLLYQLEVIADMEFVTSGTCVNIKYNQFWARVNFSRINAKITLSVKFAVFRLKFSQKNLTICSK